MSNTKLVVVGTIYRPPSQSDFLKNYDLNIIKQLIEDPTRVTCSSSAIFDHILVAFPDRFSRRGAIDVGRSDHQLIYCTRKISRIKRGTQIISFLLKNYSADIYEQALGRLDFPNFQNFENINDAYSNSLRKS